MKKECYKKFMETAIKEAELSLRQGNRGFGAVLVKNGKLFTKAHDTPITGSDPTAHAEMNVIRTALKKLQNLSGCTMIATHEPCPMCTGALIWTDVSEIVFGASISESKKLGRTMIDVSCKEIIKKSPGKIKIKEGVLKEECLKLYDEETRKWIKELRGKKAPAWKGIEKKLLQKRAKWFEENRAEILKNPRGNDVEKAYRLLLMKLGIKKAEAPVVEKSDKRIVFHSRNFCPSLEACKMLGLDTKKVCREILERPTDKLIKKINPKLTFSRNYRQIRPYKDYCEEIITLED